jgi:hypothetical protein
MSPEASVVSLIESGRAFERLALRNSARTPVQWVLSVGCVDRYPAPVSPRIPLTAFV